MPYINETGNACLLCGTDKNVKTYFLDNKPTNRSAKNMQNLCPDCYRQLLTRYFKMGKKDKLEFSKKLQKRGALKYLIKAKRIFPKIQGYVKSKVACSILNISRERLNQIKHRLKIISPYGKKNLYNLANIYKYIDTRQNKPPK